MERPAWIVERGAIAWYCNDMKVAVLLALLGSAADETAQVRSALTLEDKGNDAQALAILDQYAATDPQAALARIEASRIRMKSGQDLDRVQADLVAARNVAPDNPRADYLFGELMQERGNLVEAARSFERAVAIRIDYPEAHERLGAIYFDQGDWPKAEASYRAVASRRPERTPDRLQLALVLEKEGRLNDAETELKRLHTDQPGSLLVARRLAEFYDRTNKPKLAAKIRQSMDPGDQRKLRTLKRSPR
jgi:tetratricopeptide (TPR) repeat protein